MGGGVVEIVIPRQTFMQMQMDGVISLPTPGVHYTSGATGTEFIVQPPASGQILNTIKY